MITKLERTGLVITFGGSIITLNVHEQKEICIIHESKWAISKKCGNKVYKIFLHDNYPKIQKEVFLLKLSTGQEVNLLFDSVNKHWVCESDYMELFPIVDNSFSNDLVSQIRNVFGVWRYDSRYRNAVMDEWSNVIVPWYCTLLQKYVSDSERLIVWLQDSRSEHFIHGDFTLSNVYLDHNNKAVVIDFENATLGPLLWDEATLVYSLIEQKQYAVAKQLYEAFSCGKEILHTICGIRLAQGIRKPQNVQKRIEAYHYVLNYYSTIS